jgi:uncharacterized protein (DUF885 family)
MKIRAGKAVVWAWAVGFAVTAHALTPTEQLNALAERCVDESLAYDPTLTYTTGLRTTVHDRFPDRSPEALAALDAKERADLAALTRLDARALSDTAKANYARLRERLESDLQLRICRQELWNVNHFDGWQTNFADVADAQPVATSDERAQALRRWSSVPHYVDVEIANLRRGLAAGYSAPKSVVQRVINQIDAIVAAAPEASPYYSPATHSDDAAFKANFKRVISDHVDPALRRYHDFLVNTYLPKARDGVAVTDLPDGEACYRAFLRMETTLDRGPRAVFELGQQTVSANEAEILRLGSKLYGTSDIPATLAAAKANAGEHFGSKDELLHFSRDFLARAKSVTAARLIARLPEQDVVVEPERDFEEQAAVSSHLDLQPDITKPATYRIELNNWASETRAEAEIVVVHESLPGHHLQVALAREIAPPDRLSKLIANAAYQEGWARYAEGLGEEAGIYDTPDAKILRRIWPARGMVVDPGLHAFHWTREQAIQYLVSTGRFTPKSADDTVDRIAVMPGQLTAYDSGGLEIRALRAEAQQRLGERFDLKEFNKVVLEEGVVPLSELRRHVEVWLGSPAGQ